MSKDARAGEEIKPDEKKSWTTETQRRRKSEPRIDTDETRIKAEEGEKRRARERSLLVRRKGPSLHKPDA